MPCLVHSGAWRICAVHLIAQTAKTRQWVFVVYDVRHRKAVFENWSRKVWGRQRDLLDPCEWDCKVGIRKVLPARFRVVAAGSTALANCVFEVCGLLFISVPGGMRQWLRCPGDGVVVS